MNATWKLHGSIKGPLDFRRKFLGYYPVITLWCSIRSPVYLNVLNCCTVVFFGLLVLHHSVVTGQFPKILCLKSTEHEHRFYFSGLEMYKVLPLVALYQRKLNPQPPSQGKLIKIIEMAWCFFVGIVHPIIFSHRKILFNWLL